jgi:O-antigen/teichoic acid export membrane protein
VATSRAVAGLRQTEPERAGRVIGLLLNLGLITSLAAMLLAIAFAEPIARYFGAPQLAHVFTVSAPYIVFASVSAVQIGALNGLEAFAPAATLLAIEGVLTGVIIAAAASVGGVAGAVAAIVAAAAVACVARGCLLATTCRAQRIAIRRRDVSAEIPFVRSLVFPSLAFALSAHPFPWLARGILARGPHGLVEIAVFAAAHSWGSAVLVIPQQITRPAMPILTSLLTTGRKGEFRRLLRHTLLLAAGTAAAVAAALMLLAPQIMRSYGPQFATGAIVLAIVAGSSIIDATSAALRAALVAAGHVWGQALQAIVWGITLVMTFYAFRQHGAIALAAAHGAASAVALGVQTMMVVTQARAVQRHPQALQ